MPFVLLVVLFISGAESSKHSCPQINSSQIDFDGMPLCPSIVEQHSAWNVYACAISQAKTWHHPTESEKEEMGTLLDTFQTTTIKGDSKATTKIMLTSANSLGLQACRVNQMLMGIPDSFMLFYTKPGVTNYSGPFLMLRRFNHSRIVIIGPHDDSDGTYADTKIGLQHSHALATISNGHMRGNVGSNEQTNGDFVHETNNLGTWVVGYFAKLFPGSVVMQIHGWANPTKVLVDCRNAAMLKVFEAAIVANSRVPSGNFGPLKADFTIDHIVDTNYYLKTEMPTAVHENNHGIIAAIVKQMECYPWAWGN